MRKLLFLTCLLGGSLTFAKGTNFGLMEIDIEPIVGYERIQRLAPYRHTTEGIFYGVRVIAGIPLVAIEAEGIRTTSAEAFPDYGMTSKDTTDDVKLGLRSHFHLFSLLYASARAGGQARKNRHEETIAGVTTVTNDPIYISPYLGAGVRAYLTRHFRFDADFTVVFQDVHNWRYYEYQTSAGFAIVFP